jgi:23S rRNA pseudouridine1911/1915/1917 synthase
MSEYIFYENDDYIIAKKPNGLLSEEDPAGSINLRQILEQYLRNKYPWKKQLICQLPNRLDKPVGGLLICAKKQSILKDLQSKFYLRKVDKFYFAVVEGIPAKKEDRLENYLVKSQKEFKAFPAHADTKEAKLAKLSYKCIVHNDEHSLLLVQLHTGKFHQIRFQLSQLGHPIWNDEWYGAKRITPEIRIGLFSFYLGFEEPNTGVYREFKLSPPEIAPWNMFGGEIENVVESSNIKSFIKK